MRHEPSFLKDILSACLKIEAIVAATSEDLFLKNEVLPAAVLHHLTVSTPPCSCTPPTGSPYPHDGVLRFRVWSRLKLRTRAGLDFKGAAADY